MVRNYALRSMGWGGLLLPNAYSLSFHSLNNLSPCCYKTDFAAGVDNKCILNKNFLFFYVFSGLSMFTWTCFLFTMSGYIEISENLCIFHFHECFL